MMFILINILNVAFGQTVVEKAETILKLFKLTHFSTLFESKQKRKTFQKHAVFPSLRKTCFFLNLVCVFGIQNSALQNLYEKWEFYFYRHLIRVKITRTANVLSRTCNNRLFFFKYIF